MASPKCLGRSGPNQKKKKKKDMLDQYQRNPTFLGSTQLLGLAHLIYLIIYYNISKFQKKIKKTIQKLVIFSYIFLPILFNIGLYFFTVRYKSNIKILGFLRNISKKIQKNLKTFKLIFLFKRQ